MGDFVTRDAKHYPRQGRVTYRTIAEVVEKFNLTVVRCPVFHKLPGKAKVILAGEVCPDCPRCTRVRNTRKLVRIDSKLFRDAANIAEQTIKEKEAKLAESAENSQTYTHAQLIPSGVPCLHNLMEKTKSDVHKCAKGLGLDPTNWGKIKCIRKILRFLAKTNKSTSPKRRFIINRTQ